MTCGRFAPSLGTKELEDFTQKLKDRAVKGQDPLMQFLAEPSFEERYDPSRRELILFSDLVNYKAVLLLPTMPWPRNTANSPIGTPG